MPGIKAKLLQQQGKWDFIIFTLLTVFSLLNGQATIFYIIYLFWWNEWCRIIVDKLAYRRNPNVILPAGVSDSFLSSLVPMIIYLVFIIVFFGFIANWQNKEITIVNMGILTFQNWFFNINLLIILLERIIVHCTKQSTLVYFGAFTPDMIILHVSIILGGLLMFFVVKNYPKLFTPANLWASVIIISPFLLLRTISVRSKLK